MTADAQNISAEIDAAPLVECCTLLDFALSGPNGLPAGAVVETAILQLCNHSFPPSSGTRPLKIDLVSLGPLASLTSESVSQQPALGSLKVVLSLAGSEAMANMSIDVTLLMAKAQRLGMTDFQLRIREELRSAVASRPEGKHTAESDRISEGPVLTVTYYEHPRPALHSSP